MKSGRCPKCNSSNVFKQMNGVGPERLYWVHTDNLSSYQTAGETYLCVDCGYFENYIPVDKRIQDVQKTWTKIT